MPIAQIKKDLRFQASGVEGCLISHSHNDHAKGVKGLMAMGIDCYMAEETAKELKATGHRLHTVIPGRTFRVGPFLAMAFDLVHDVKNLGYLIVAGSDKIVFAVDTNYIPNRFAKPSHIMLGISYDRDILRRNVRSGKLDMTVAKRILKNHMSIKTAIDFLKATDLSLTREIHLLHLSDANSDGKAWKDRIETMTGIPVYIGG